LSPSSSAVIAIDYTPAHEQGGGIGRYVRELVNALAKQDRQTRYKLFVSGAVPSELPEPPALNFDWCATRISPKWLARLWHRARLPFPVEIFTGRVHLYHATDFVLPPTLPSMRTVLTVHDLSFVRVPEAASPSLKAYLDKVVPRSVERAHHIFADSQATKNDLMALYNTPAEKITVLLSGVDARFRPITDSSVILTTRNKYRLGSRPYILSVGTVQPRKNYVRLVEALSQLRRSGFDVSLVIVGGKGWLEAPIYSAIRDLGMSDDVHFTGFADEADLPALYSGALCVALPSLYEGFGIPVLEGMACGTPVITSNVSSLPEAAGDAGLLIDPYSVEDMTEALRRVIEDTELRTNLISKGFAHAARFTWDASAAHLREVYSRLIAGSV
jgi:glycosyltransferase involved in cell wall biosynthesis